MNKFNTRQEKSANTKKKLFNIAVTLIKEKGYKNVTISEICKSAGVAKGSFYIHYSSKEDIIRESYYTDMGEYIKEYYSKFINQNPNSSHLERIKYFLNLELAFAEYAGYELTCLAYSLNLNTCIPGPSNHNAQRTSFTKMLYDEIVLNENSPALCSNDDTFTYLESFIRGLMATWCFSNNSFNIKEKGELYIPYIVNSIYK